MYLVQIFCGVKLSAVSNCPFLPMVSNCPVSNCPRCQIVRGVKLSGVKLSGVKLSAVSNCPRCQIVLVSNCPPTATTKCGIILPERMLIRQRRGRQWETNCVATVILIFPLIMPICLNLDNSTWLDKLTFFLKREHISRMSVLKK